MAIEQLEYRRPPYALQSVDNALRVLHVLRDYGAVRIIDVSERLGIAPSTAHRIMAMLVYQGFAVKDEGHSYFPGPALSAPLNTSERTLPLTTAARPVLTALSEELSEVVSLSVRLRSHTRVLLTVDGTGKSDFGDRSGSVYPAHSTSGGKALLALEPPELVANLYRGDTKDFGGYELSEPAYAELVADLERTRRRGFALIDEAVHRGMSSVAVPVVPTTGEACAIVVMLPPARLRAFQLDTSRMPALLAAARRLTTALNNIER